MCNGTPFTVKKISPRAGIELGPLDPLSYRDSYDFNVNIQYAIAIYKKKITLNNPKSAAIGLFPRDSKASWLVGWLFWA